MNKKKIKTVEQYVMEQTPRLQEQEHIHRVVRYTEYIAKKKGIKKLNILRMSALLHDMGRTPAGIEIKKREKIKGHAAVGAAMAYEYLAANGWQIKTIEEVCHCIRAHSTGGDTKPETIEEKILYDADKLDILGAIGTARIIGYHSQRDGSYCGAHKKGSKDREDSLLCEYERIIKKIPQTLYTKEAKQLAKKKN